MVLDRTSRVTEIDDSAKAYFGLNEGDTVRAMHLAPDEIAQLLRHLDQMTGMDTAEDQHVAIAGHNGGPPTIVHLRRLSRGAPDAQSDILVVSNFTQWLEGLDQVLDVMFALTQAEVAVVCGLFEGHTVNTFATLRNTSEGTVRSQVKAILSKTQSTSQTDVLRLVLSLRSMVSEQTAQNGVQMRGKVARRDWIDDEVWKPFERSTLADGRSMQYLVLGPADGAPVLL